MAELLRKISFNGSYHRTIKKQSKSNTQTQKKRETIGTGEEQRGRKREQG